MYSQDHNGPRFIWTVGFLALGTLSAIGAAALFPWYLAIAIAVLVVGLASACAYQFRVTNNPLYLVAMCLMTALASFLDGVSVWELLNETQNSGLHAASANEGALGAQLKSTQEQAESIRAQIATVVQEYTNMDNDGNGANDGLIPGRIALAESLKADLANVQARVDDLQAKTITAASTTAVTDAERHILLQMADEHPHPAQWLIMWASVVFLIPEFTLALLAWSMHGGRRAVPTHLQETSEVSHAMAGFPAQLPPQYLQYLLQQQLHTLQTVGPVHQAVSPMMMVPAASPQSAPGLAPASPAVAAQVALAGRSTTTTTTREEAVEFASQPASPAGSAPLQGNGPAVPQTGSAPALPETSTVSSGQPPSSSAAGVGESPILYDHPFPDGLSVGGSNFVRPEQEGGRTDRPAHRPGHISRVREAKKHGAFGGSPTRDFKEQRKPTRDLNKLVSAPSFDSSRV
ncbi:MAG: hypothetical protein DVB23_002184 [Verrucomicrobia bacterium]|nr:MAG: hypothetical protein DVB23_002184 [Verrucomicrobiota bacterium]